MKAKNKLQSFLNFSKIKVRGNKNQISERYAVILTIGRKQSDLLFFSNFIFSFQEKASLQT